MGFSISCWRYRWITVNIRATAANNTIIHESSGQVVGSSGSPLPPQGFVTCAKQVKLVNAVNSTMVKNDLIFIRFNLYSFTNLLLPTTLLVVLFVTCTK